MNDFARNWRPAQPDVSSKLAGRLDELRSALRLRDPNLIAMRSGVSYLTLGPDRGELHVPFWEQVCTFSFPELVGYGSNDEHLPDFQQALLLYYLVTADGAPLSGRWVSFADLPDGRMYNTAFQGYTGDEIVKAFGFELDGVKSACLKANGRHLEIGSASFVFQALPGVPLMMTYWLGDEDFPSSCKILFDESACHYLPIDVCAILGSTLTRRIIAGAPRL